MSLRNAPLEPTPFSQAPGLGQHQYAEAMKRGDEFPPVIAHGKMGKLIMADGNHRLQAAIKAKKPRSPRRNGPNPALSTAVLAERTLTMSSPTTPEC